MSEPAKPEEAPVEKTQSPAAEAAPEHHMEDEEKVLAGRKDVNMTALLRKDVKGG